MEILVEPIAPLPEFLAETVLQVAAGYGA